MAFVPDQVKGNMKGQLVHTVKDQGATGKATLMKTASKPMPCLLKVIFTVVVTVLWNIIFAMFVIMLDG